MEHDQSQPVRKPAAPAPLRLPLSAETIQLDAEGAQKVARLACRMAAAKASSIESDKRYAMRYAAFVTGTLAAQCTSEAQWMAMFEQFLERVHRYLDIGCSNCMDEPHEWTA